MKRTHHLYYLLLTLLFLTGCNDPKHVTDALTRAEALMNEHPDSAWTVLNAISPDEMGQNRTRARYALLYTQAQDKTYRDETNDSLISVAVDYYRDTDDVRCKFLSYYYKGRVYTNAKDYLNAMTCYMEAEQLVDTVGDDYLTGLLYAELGRIYRLYYDYPKSLESHHKAAECYERAGKIRHRNYMWLNQSSVFRNMNEYDESESLLRMVWKSGKEIEDSVLIRNSIGGLVMLCIEQNRMLEAKELYEQLVLVANVDFGSSSFMGKLAKMYVAERDFIRAKRCLETGWKRARNRTDSVGMYFSSSELLKAQGADDMAYRELMKGLSFQNDEAHQALQQPILTVQRDYLSEKLELEAYRLQMEKMLKLLSILLGSLLIVVVCYIFRIIMKKRHEEAQRTIRGLEIQNEETEKQKEQAEKDKEQLKKENLKISSLLQKMESDKNVAEQTIIDLKNEITKQEKENNETIAGLVQNLENENKVNVETIISLRESLESKERVFHQYEHNNEKLRKDLQDAIGIKSRHISALLKDKFEFMGEWILLYEEELTLKNYREKKIKRAVDDTRARYFKGKNVFRDLEVQVNLYCDNAMQHFREEIQLNDEKDYSRVCCLFAGIPPHIIAWMMDEKTDVVYQRKSRLRKKIASFPSIHQSLFLGLLPK